MSDWDASDNETGPVAKAPVVVKRTKWDEEEEDNDVAEDWDVSEEEEESKPAAAPVAPPKKKGTLKQKLAEKEAAKAAKIAAGEYLTDDDDDEVDEATKRQLDKEREIAADLRNATELLGVSKLNGGSGTSSVPAELSEILSFNPKTKEDFAHLSNLIYEQLIKRHETKPLYATFVEMHVRELAQPLRDVDVRRAASALTTLANEKQKEKSQAGKKKTKAATKPVLGAAKVISKIDTSVYEEALDDFGKEPDDFM